MKNVNHTRVLTGILVVCFLLSLIISKAFNPRDFFNTASSFGISKKAPAPIKSEASDTQLLDEEEGEEDKSGWDFEDGNNFKDHPDFVSFDLCHHSRAFGVFYPGTGFSSVPVSAPAFSNSLYISIRTFRL